MQLRLCGGQDAYDKGTGGEVANALVCKTSIHGFNSHPVLQSTYVKPQPISFTQQLT